MSRFRIAIQRIDDEGDQPERVTDLDYIEVPAPDEKLPAEGDRSRSARSPNPGHRP